MAKKNTSEIITVKDVVKELKREHLTFGTARVQSWEAWLVVVLAVGLFMGVVTFVNKSEDFVLSCEYGLEECGGLWTHSVVHGGLTPDVSSLYASLVTPFAETANAIGAMPALSLFLLGFVSSALIFGLVWDKFSLAPAKKKVKARRIKIKVSGARGMISRDFLIMAFLAIMMTVVISSPVSYGSYSSKTDFSKKEVAVNSSANIFSSIVETFKSGSEGILAITENTSGNPEPEKIERKVKTMEQMTIKRNTSKFSVGENIIVIARVFNVRAEADGKILRERNYGAKGVIAAGPVMRGRVWWKINFENGESGWVAESFLKKVNAGEGQELRKFFPVASTTSSTSTSNLKAQAKHRWMASHAGVAKINIQDSNKVFSVKKNGVEIWDRSTNSRPFLKMEFLVSPSDVIEFEVDEENFTTNVEVAPLVGN
ncbi:hypothetical protein A3B18_00370 [Candidatus Giovannonibacteria bacterium RIFCSPLOWO2_01_FULL_46_13]|uniref:SH3b domain-containing protein n=1 Tax=Candidatus Giovannonibacteria bacterium RIFCSPLOWO2_01_FULL_46_13 TaxID=1798352 RepID=A0A1F5X4B4_9BACT|nr:MAG: hypothetical protein A3B18_00370 [Candidatus Giovannonibacteria bacterium RIFCSPLOWO2_01_FULL_46_13]